jgi:hypothetical protein
MAATPLFQPSKDFLPLMPVPAPESCVALEQSMGDLVSLPSWAVASCSMEARRGQQRGAAIIAVFL